VLLSSLILVVGLVFQWFRMAESVEQVAGPSVTRSGFPWGMGAGLISARSMIILILILIGIVALIVLLVRGFMAWATRQRRIAEDTRVGNREH
jgi:hypothetical protein